MSMQDNIEKLYTTDATIEQDPIPFTMHMNFVLQNLHDLAALGLWSHLTSLPSGWVVNKEQIQNKTKLGRDAVRRLFNVLKENLLIEIIKPREQGKFLIPIIRVRSGREFKKMIEKQNLIKTHQLKNDELSTEKEPAPEIPAPAQPAPANPLLINKIYNKKDIVINNTAAQLNVVKEQKRYRNNYYTEKPRPTGFSNVENQSTSYRPCDYQKPKPNADTEELIQKARLSVGLPIKRAVNDGF